ncbi:TPA: hypothetical protein ACMDUI_004560 [Vibrio parahaemolyticus]
MKTNVHHEKCDLCNTTFSFGAGAYHGQYIKTYGVLVCDICYKSGVGGWVPHNEIKLIRIAKDKGLPLPARLPNGLLPHS